MIPPVRSGVVVFSRTGSLLTHIARRGVPPGCVGPESELGVGGGRVWALGLLNSFVSWGHQTAFTFF